MRNKGIGRGRFGTHMIGTDRLNLPLRGLFGLKQIGYEWMVTLFLNTHPPYNSGIG